jgi:carboxylesterase
VVLEDSYHMVTLDKQRQVVVDKARMFVESIVDAIANATAFPAMQAAA